MTGMDNNGEPLVVGVVGLGAMGGAMAANLRKAGLPVVVFDVESARMERLVELGATAVASVEEVASSADVVITSLPSVSAFEAVVAALGAGGGAGLVVAETSTLPLEAKERAHEALAAREITLLDCPLSGTGHQAIDGDIIVLASGDEAAMRRCAPAFAAVARGTHVIGAFGAGSKLKFIANLLVGIHNVAAGEALNLARTAGLDLEQALEVLTDGAGTSRMLEIRGPKMAAGDYASGVRMSIFQKDVKIINEFAAGLGAPVPLFALCAQLYVAAEASGFVDEDTAAVYEVLARMSATGREQMR